MNRRESLNLLAAGAGLALVPGLTTAGNRKQATTFEYCLNTSTINGSKIGIRKAIEIAARAGYQHVELWLPDVVKYRDEGNTLASLDKFIKDNGVSVANTIAFAPWMVPDETKRKEGFKQMEVEMTIMSELGCRRIAAAPAGLTKEDSINLLEAGEWYRDLLALGKKTGVMPQLEFWGMSPLFYHFGQVLMVAAAANDPATRLLPDIFHLFRGGSGFDSLKLIDGSCIEIFHLNDYPSTPREEQKDKDRIYPGDGVAPIKQALQYLSRSGHPKILSLELFNESYWAMDPLTVAKTGLDKMRARVTEAEGK